eukprot:EG_transcript_32165
MDPLLLKSCIQNLSSVLEYALIWNNASALFNQSAFVELVSAAGQVMMACVFVTGAQDAGASTSQVRWRFGILNATTEWAVYSTLQANCTAALQPAGYNCASLTRVTTTGPLNAGVVVGAILGSVAGVVLLLIAAGLLREWVAARRAPDSPRGPLAFPALPPLPTF